MSTEHIHVSFLAASPFTHLGHMYDVCNNMTDGSKFVGISSCNKAVADNTRLEIAQRQSTCDIHFEIESSIGETLARAFKSCNSPVVHLHFGFDRKAFAERIRDGLINQSIKEVRHVKPSAVVIHCSENERTHGLSGTSMRQAAVDSDISTFTKHLGTMFHRNEAETLMKITADAISSGKIKLNRRKK